MTEPTLTVYIHKGEKKYVAECLEIDAVSQGDTVDEAIKNIKEAIELYFQEEKVAEIDLPKEPSIVFSLGVHEYALR